MQLLLFVCGLTLSGCLGANDSSVSVTNGIVSSSTPKLEPAAVEAAWQPVFSDIRGEQRQPFRNDATRAVVLIFVLQDCPIACSYMPEINRLWQAYHEKGIEVLLVHADPEITTEEAQKHAGEYQLQCPVLLDVEHLWVKKTGVRKTPEAAVLSRTGELLYRGRINDQYVDLGKRRGQVTSNDLREALDAIVARRPVPQPRTEAVGCFIPKLSSGE